MTDLLSRLKAALADRYAIERELGSGGMATVYLAEDLKLHRKVAVKVLRPELAAALGPERFLQEIDIAAKLTHPHILGLHDCGEASGFLYYVMPHIEGESLRDKLAHEGELPIGEAVRVLRDVVDALSHAHKHGVVHRDIKPDNVMLSERHALVTDFGVAKAVSEATGAHKLTTEGVALGTPAYMSPEQAAADKHIDHRADIYAVGALAYELLTGRPPFTGTTPQEVLSAQVTDTPDPVRKYRESVPPAFEQLVMKCLEKKAADRWQSAEELLPQLEALATPSGGVTPTGTMPVDRVAKRRWMMAGAAVTVAAIIAVIAVVATLARGSGVALDPERVVVAVVRNETGDPSLDHAGRQAGHWITQGLQQTGIVQAVPWETALQSSQYVQTEVTAARVRDRVQALAEETGAGVVISGAYYQRGDSILYQLEVTDATEGRLLTALDPQAAPFDSPDEAIEPLRQQVMGFLATYLDERISTHGSSVAQPPSFEAYQAFDEGLGHYLRGENPDALAYLYQAFELDSTFVTPIVYAILAHSNARELAQRDSLVGVLERYRDRLSDYDRHWLDHFRTNFLDRDPPAALRAIRRAAELAPGSKAVWNRGYWARFCNRPQEAVDALLSLDPERGPMRGWRGYFTVLIQAYLDLNEHEKALEAAQKFRETYGDGVQYAGFALAAMGRIEELNALLDEIVALPEQGLSQGNWILSIAVYLRRHGHTDAAETTVDRAAEWYESRIPETKSNEEWRERYAEVLYVADRCDEAYGFAKPLSEEFPDNINYRGLVGIVAACQGDQDEARQVSQWLEALDRPRLWGRHKLWRSGIAGTLGDGETAVALLRQAIAEGTLRPTQGDPFWIAFESIRDYPPFLELMRPKG